MRLFVYDYVVALVETFSADVTLVRFLPGMYPGVDGEIGPITKSTIKLFKIIYIKRKPTWIWRFYRSTRKQKASPWNGPSSRGDFALPTGGTARHIVCIGTWKRKFKIVKKIVIKYLTRIHISGPTGEIIRPTSSHPYATPGCAPWGNVAGDKPSHTYRKYI